mgnify:CR=1 FL=1
MQKVTISKIIKTKMIDWLDTITDELLRDRVRDCLIVSGGCIASMFLDEDVNDFDVYIQDQDVLIALAKYYIDDELVLDGRLKVEYIKKRFDQRDVEDDGHIVHWGDDAFATTDYVRLMNLKEDQVKLDVYSEGVRYEPTKKERKKLGKYHKLFVSQNAISLSGDIQIVTRFSGTASEIHKNYDFIHATNYFTMADGVITNLAAVESLLTKRLKYQGSLYPVTSIVRMKKFILRGWNIGAGEMLKILFQVSQLELRDIFVLEEQLIGVDIAYFSTVIKILSNYDGEITSTYLNDIIDKVFSQHDDTI